MGSSCGTAKRYVVQYITTEPYSNQHPEFNQWCGVVHPRRKLCSIILSPRPRHSIHPNVKSSSSSPSTQPTHHFHQFVIGRQPLVASIPQNYPPVYPDRRQDMNMLRILLGVPRILGSCRLNWTSDPLILILAFDSKPLEVWTEAQPFRPIKF